MLKIVFMGSGAFACPLLQAVAGAVDMAVCAVVSAPDRPAGRGKLPQPCPVKLAAEAWPGIPLWTPDNANGDDFLAEMEALRPDVLVVSDYGQFLRRRLLAIPRLGAINVHPSLLPKYRGASPIQWALANGEEKTGVAVLRVTEKMDAGEIFAMEETRIGEEEDAPALSARLSRMGAALLLETLRAMAGGTAAGIPQDETQASFAPRLKKEDGLVDWRCSAAQIRNRLLGFSPWPGGFTFLPDGTLLKLLTVGVEETAYAALPGAIVQADAEALVAVCGEGTALRLEQIQPAGKTAMRGVDFVRGRGIRAGDRLGGDMQEKETGT